MLNDKQREMVKDYFKGNPKATPKDIEQLLGFKMDMATVIETGLLKIETADGDGGSGSEVGVASGEIKVEFSMSSKDGMDDLKCAVTVGSMQMSKQNIETKLCAYILKKVMLAVREKLVGILQDGDKMLSMKKNAEEELKKEWRTFLGKEGA